MEIKQKQWQLYFLGYYGNKISEIDGIWGNRSRTATKNFQRDNNMKATGYFDSAVEAKTIEIIKAIQIVIKVADVDGLAGPKTVEATKVYQKSNGLVADGIAGPKTRTKTDADKKESEKIDFWDCIKYFTRDEFACKCGGKYCNGFPVEPNETLIRVADKVREHFGLPMSVNSGIRCAKHNTKVGGVSNSRHRSGKAMDFNIKGKTSAEILAYVKTIPDIRYCYAITPKDVHMDVK